MSDFASSLPVRTENPGDLEIKIVDSTTPSQKLTINSDGSINIKVVDTAPGTEITDHDTDAAVAASATGTHTYTSTGNFYLQQVEVSGSGRIKVTININAVPKFVFFNSTSNPNMSLRLEQPILVTIGQTVTIDRLNRENQPQDVYSTIIGYNG